MFNDRKLIIVSGANFLRAYSGVKYLADSLFDKGIKIEIFAPIPRQMIDEVKNYRFPVHSLFGAWYGLIPRLRVHMFRLRIRWKALREPSSWLFTDLSFFPEAVAIKRAKPKTTLIHYCLELLTPEEFPELKNVQFYEDNANVPDLILDVDANRAAARKKRFCLTREIMVLPNTLPLTEIPRHAPNGTLSTLAGGGLPPDVPILVYIGGVHKGTGFDTIIDALSSITQPFFFLGFCNGSNRDVESIRHKVNARLGSHRGRICNSVPRQLLLSCLHEAAAGLVYYPYTDAPSINQLYCAPTKLFEYLSVGLPVIASSNPPLIDLIKHNRLGVCARDDGVVALRDAIDCLLNSKISHDYIRKVFSEKLCYEKVSGTVINSIIQII